MYGRRVFSVCFLAAVFPVQLSADIPPTAIVAALKTHATSVQRGVCRIQGHIRIQNHSTNAFTFETDTYCFIAFDDLTNRFRFDRKQDFRTEVGPMNLLLQHVSTPEYVLNRDRSQRRVTVHEAGFRFVRGTQPFDPRTIAIWNYHEIISTIDGDFFRPLASENITESISLADGVVKTTWVFGKAKDCRRTYWLDSQRDLVPIRMEERYGDFRDVAANRPIATWSDPVQTTECHWIEKENVWVPDNVIIVSRSGIGVGDNKLIEQREWKLQFDWESINRELDEELFTIAGLDLRTKQSVVIDATVPSNPVMISHPRLSNEQLELITSAREATKEVEPGTRSSLTLIIINVVLFVLITAKILLRKSRKNAVQNSESDSLD